MHVLFVVLSIDRKSYNALPESLTIRECCFQVEQAGFRCKKIVLATTLLDADEFSVNDLALLYRARWHAELDLRSLKTVMKMDVLRCKTPELVHKEIWTHILAYNLIRTIMAQAATKHDIEPRSISFKGTIQTLDAFQPVIASMGQNDPACCRQLYEQLLDCVASHRVGNRPDRFEPRKVKRRYGSYDWLTKPRKEEKMLLVKRHNEI
ncbi:transposase [Bythopirellula goksoeyrii]|uniref:Transposase DDE domain protein n=1 Tax=Bythopirellula goksoeyrii TaxID=1400387 RepID=A0A5B9Q278_9BACT|nr:transposase [Bythopirellula goksoeyrii]QEG33108.1 Transposase DDE domain protein [Bythopirellula goksoeyrii]